MHIKETGEQPSFITSCYLSMWHPSPAAKIPFAQLEVKSPQQHNLPARKKRTRANGMLN